MKLCSEDYGKPLWWDKKRYFGKPWSFTRYILSANKIYLNRGFLSIREDRLELYRVTDIAVVMPLTQRIFGCGTIIIHAVDRTHPMFAVKNIKHPRKVLQLLETCVASERKKYNIIGRDMLGALN